MDLIGESQVGSLRKECGIWCICGGGGEGEATAATRRLVDGNQAAEERRGERGEERDGEGLFFWAMSSK